MFMMTTGLHNSARFGWQGLRLQAGVTLIEALISLALSMIVTSTMVMLMANSLGTTSRIIQMSQLTGELRNAMVMITRDVRRANCSANATFCYANPDCGLDGSAGQFADIDVTDGSCFIFGLDRDFDGNAANDDAGAFRRVVTDGVGRIEMWVGDNAPNCTASHGDWLAVTDPDFVDVTTFAINDSTSYTGTVGGETGSTVTHRSRQIHVQVEGRLVLDNSISRRIEDISNVRNDLIISG